MLKITYIQNVENYLDLAPDELFLMFYANNNNNNNLPE